MHHYRTLVCPRLPSASLGAVNRVLEHLLPPDSALSSLTLVSWIIQCTLLKIILCCWRVMGIFRQIMVHVSIHQVPTQQRESGRETASEEVMKKMGLRVISKQVQSTKYIWTFLCVFCVFTRTPIHLWVSLLIICKLWVLLSCPFSVSFSIQFSWIPGFSLYCYLHLFIIL